MSDRSLADEIRDKKRQLAEAEALVARLRGELIDAKTALLDGPAKPGPSRTPTNSTEMAAAVLRDNGQPMHVNEIISAIERDFHIQVRYATLVGNISRLVKKNRLFARVGPNRFGLLAWNEDAELAELFGQEQWEREQTGT